MANPASPDPPLTTSGLLNAGFVLLRPANLLIVAATFLLIYFGLVLPVLRMAGLTPSLSPTVLILLVLSLITLTAAGYVINDIMDQHADGVNAPYKRIVGRRVPERMARNWYGSLVILAGLLATAAALLAGRVNDLWVFVLAWGALHLYSTKWKGTGLPANILIGLCCAGVVILPVFAEWEAWQTAFSFPASQVKRLGLLFQAYVFFAFATTVLREIIKDLEDLKGDDEQGYRTLPVRIGQKRTILICAAISGLIVVGLVYYSLRLNMTLLEKVLAAIIVVLPLLLVCLELLQKRHHPKFSTLSMFLKIIMVNGLILLAVLLVIYTH